MIQTIVLIQNGRYPFGQVTSRKRIIKVQDIRTYSSLQQLRQQKCKVQSIFSSNDKGSQTTISSTQNQHIIRLLKIYQSELNLHFLFEYVPYSLHQYIEDKLYGQTDMEKSHIMEMNSKLFLKKVCYELGSIVNFLIKKHVKTQLDYHLFGIDEEENLKFFLDPKCQIINSKCISKSVGSSSLTSKQIQNQLKQFYENKKQQILFKLESHFRKLKKKDHYVPNFLIKGNQLIFCHSPSQSQSECSSPCPSNFTETSFTQRCESINNSNNTHETPTVRKTHSNLFNKLKKTQSYNLKSQSNKKLQENINKLQMLRKKSKKINQQVYQSYLSNSHNFRHRNFEKQPNEFENRQSSTQASHLFNKRTQRTEQEPWRNSQIPSNFRKTHLPKNSSSTAKSPNRFGINFDGKRSKSNRNHKSSFQFKPSQRQKQWFNPNKSFDKSYQDDYMGHSSTPNMNDKSFHQTTKSIRIQLQQTTNRNKQRKNSYKVKILTCQEMQLDGDNVQEFVFNAMGKNFQNNKENEEEENSQERSYSNQQTGNEDQNEQQFDQTSTHSKRSKYSNNYENHFSDKFKTQRQDIQDFYSKHSESPVRKSGKQKQRQGSAQKNIFEKYYQQFNKKDQKIARNQKLEQKIKLAKQKAENVLSKYMKTKKYSNGNGNSNSKLLI